MCLGLTQITRTTPLRFTILHLSQIFFTEALTFISSLHQAIGSAAQHIGTILGGRRFVKKAAVPVDQIPQVIPEIKRRGGTDVVVTKLVQIVP